MRVATTQSQLLTAEEAAQRLGITVAAVERLVKEGKLSAYRLGGQFVRFRAQDVEQLTGAQRAIPSDAPSIQPSWREQLREFFYLHDFYLLAACLLLVLLAALIRFA